MAVHYPCIVGKFRCFVTESLSQLPTKAAAWIALAWVCTGNFTVEVHMDVNVTFVLCAVMQAALRAQYGADPHAVMVGR